jgi:hypothetical protein
MAALIEIILKVMEHPAFKRSVGVGVILLGIFFGYYYRQLFYEPWLINELKDQNAYLRKKINESETNNIKLLSRIKVKDEQMQAERRIQGNQGNKINELENVIKGYELKESLPVVSSGWLYENKPQHYFKSQLMIGVEDINPSKNNAVIYFKNANGDKIKSQEIRCADRIPFLYENQNYLFDVIDVGVNMEGEGTGVNYSIVKVKN